MWRCATSTSPAPIRRAAPASRRRAPRTSSRSPARRRWASAAICRYSAPTIPTPDGTCLRDYIHVTDLTRAHLAALRHLRAGGASDIFNCGYGRGFSVLEVIDAVKRAAGCDFEVRLSARRPGDPARVVAASGRIRQTLEWVPAHDTLDTVVQHALGWEKRLTRLQN